MKWWFLAASAAAVLLGAYLFRYSISSDLRGSVVLDRWTGQVWACSFDDRRIERAHCDRLFPPGY